MEFTEGELQQWLHLRAIEWANWPAFLSQPVLPVSLVFFRWFYVLAAVIVLDVLWAAIRYSFVSPVLSNAGALFVVWLKWPAAIGGALYLWFVAHSYGPGTLALIWPFLAAVVCVPGQIGRIELQLASRLGYVEPTND